MKCLQGGPGYPDIPVVQFTNLSIAVEVCYMVVNSA